MCVHIKPSCLIRSIFARNIRISTLIFSANRVHIEKPIRISIQMKRSRCKTQEEMTNLEFFLLRLHITCNEHKPWLPFKAEWWKNNILKHYVV